MSPDDTTPTKICTVCRWVLPLSEFRVLANGRLRGDCIECEREYDRARSAKKYAVRRLWWAELKRSLGCQVCGEREACCLDWHHVNPLLGNWNQVGGNWASSKATLQAELANCALVCANCHRKIEHGVISPELVVFDPSAIDPP